MKILIVRNDKLGDFITALPSLYIIKKHLPDCHLAVFIAPLNESIALECDFIDEVIIDQKESIWRLSSTLRKRHFDLSITLFSNTRVAIAQFLAGIPKRIAPATKLAQLFFNKRIVQRRSQVKMGEFEYNIDLVKSEFPGINVTYPQPLLSFQPEHLEAKCRQFSKQHQITQKVIAFHPGFGGSSDANWTMQEYIELAQLVANQGTRDVLFTFGPGDENFFKAYHKLKGNLNSKAYFSEESVIEFTKLIACFELFISTSTGTFHLASAVGTKTMTFFSDSLFASSKRWKGIGNMELQHNYMIPCDEKERALLFEKVKSDLLKLL